MDCVINTGQTWRNAIQATKWFSFRFSHFIGENNFNFILVKLSNHFGDDGIFEKECYWFLNTEARWIFCGFAHENRNCDYTIMNFRFKSESDAVMAKLLLE